MGSSTARFRRLIRSLLAQRTLGSTLARSRPSGVEVGYPVWFFWPIFRHLTAAIIDTRDLADTLRNRFAVPESDARKIVTLYTPAQVDVDGPVLAVEQVAHAANRQRRHRLVWGGRLDRQKRFDLVVEVARAMPDVDFLCWGKAVLDEPPDMSKLPTNVTMNPPFHRPPVAAVVALDRRPLTGARIPP